MNKMNVKALDSYIENINIREKSELKNKLQTTNILKEIVLKFES